MDASTFQDDLIKLDISNSEQNFQAVESDGFNCTEEEYIHVNLPTRSHKLLVKIFEPVFESQILVPVTTNDPDEIIDPQVLRDEVYSFLFESVEKDLADSEYEVYSRPSQLASEIVTVSSADVSVTDVWITVNTNQYSTKQVNDAVANAKKENENLRQKFERLIRSNNASKFAELQSQAVEAEEREIELHKEIIALRSAFAKERKELQDKLSLQDTKIKSLETQLQESNKQHEIALTAVLEEKKKLMNVNRS